MPLFSKLQLSCYAIALGLLVPASNTAAAKQPVLRLSTDLACPWICPGTDDQEKATGILPDLAIAVFAGSAWQPQIIPPRWTSGRKRLASGKIDALVAPLSGLADDSRIGLSIAPSAIGLREQAIWAPKNNPFTWRGIQSLKDKRVAVVPGRDNGLTLLFYFENPALNTGLVPVAPQKGINTMLALLKADAVDLIIHESSQLSWHARNNNMTGLFQEATRLDTEFLYIAFTNRNSDARDMLNWYETGLKKLRQSGKLQTILAKYGQKDWLIN